MAETAAAHTRRSSLRSRITLSATAVVGVALIVGAVLFVVLLRVALVDGVRASVELDAEEFASRIETSGVPADLDELDDDRFVQLISADGAVIAASDLVEDSGPILPSASDEVWAMRIPDEDAEYLAATETAGGVTVVAGRSLATVSETTATVGWMLSAAVPLLVALVAITTWLVVGRALSPVERMRRQVDEVTDSRLDRRVADPGGSDEIARLAGTMNSMLDRLEQSQRSQRQFISDASHELRSPLASLRQYAEVALSHPDRVDARDLSEAVLDEGARLERLVQAMLVLVRADERSLDVGHTAVDVDDLVLQEARRLRDSTTLSVDTSGVGAARVSGDENLLGQVVRNLVDNAARHAATRVALSLSALSALSVLSGGDSVLFAVDDDGSGVPERERERVFERFVRLDEARARDSGGSGLGLAIVREIALAHGGDVRIVESALDGARFEVRLPAARDA